MGVKTHYDWLIVGAGFTGAVAAQQLALLAFRLALQAAQLGNGLVHLANHGAVLVRHQVADQELSDKLRDLVTGRNADRFFTRDGLDIHCQIPINLAQAVLGTKIQVRTVEGKKVVLKVPAGTPSGKKFRIKGVGVAKHDRRGDQIVEIVVSMPDQLSPEQEEMFRKFADSAGLPH